MHKQIKIILIVSCSFLLFSCGFKKVNEKKIDFNFQNVNVIGDKRSAYILKNNILLISNKNSPNKYDVELKIIKDKIVKIKNRKGRITRYNLNISTSLTLTDIKNNKIVKKNFSKNFSYNVGSTHSETINNEKNATKSLNEQLSSEIINFITLYIKK
jgi:outer membrane lipopolysaccharide assembly protein LptE/RlpB